MTRTEIFAAIKCDDQYWGTQFHDGQTTVMGWGDIERANLSDPRFVEKPTDMTYKNSPYTKELEKGEIVLVRKTVTFEEVEA